MGIRRSRRSVRAGRAARASPRQGRGGAQDRFLLDALKFKEFKAFVYMIAYTIGHPASSTTDSTKTGEVCPLLGERKQVRAGNFSPAAPYLLQSKKSVVRPARSETTSVVENLSPGGRVEPMNTGGIPASPALRRITFGHPPRQNLKITRLFSVTREHFDFQTQTTQNQKQREH